MKRLPTITELSALLRQLKTQIMDDYLQEEGDTVPSMQITIGWTPDDGTWGWQTGDNSFTGGAYLHQVWAVGYLQRRSNTRDLARELIADLWESAPEDAVQPFEWNELSKEAQRIAIDMIDHCLEHDISLGMDGGYDRRDRPRACRAALERFIAANKVEE